VSWRAVWLLSGVSAIACSDPPDPFEVVDCDATWEGTGAVKCDLACNPKPPETDTGIPPCLGKDSHDQYGPLCAAPFAFEGEHGCCYGAGEVVHFYKCEGE